LNSNKSKIQVKYLYIFFCFLVSYAQPPVAVVASVVPAATVAATSATPANSKIFNKNQQIIANLYSILIATVAALKEEKESKKKGK
jgi:ABC-type bacteriocin/lantibiotic exporter with double-glycine peptidase domain